MIQERCPFGTSRIRQSSMNWDRRVKSYPQCLLYVNEHRTEGVKSCMPMGVHYYSGAGVVDEKQRSCINCKCNLDPFGLHK